MRPRRLPVGSARPAHKLSPTPAQGNTTPMDLIRVRQEGHETLYSFLGMAYGIVSDIDMEGER